MASTGSPTDQQRPPPPAADIPIAPAAQRVLRAVTLAGGLVAAGIGLVAGVGWWIAGSPSVARVGASWAAPVRPLSTVALLAAAVALLVLWGADVRGRRPPVAAVRILAAIVLAVALDGILDGVVRREVDPASALLDLRGYPDGVPRGIGAALVLAAAALTLLVTRDRRARLVAQALALLVTAVGLLLVLDSLLARGSEGARVTYAPAMAVALVALGAGMAAHRPTDGPIAVVASGLPSGALARRIGVTALLLGPLIALLGFRLETEGHIDDPAAFAGVATVTLALVVLAGAVLAARLAPAEVARAQVETELRRTAGRLRDLYDRAPSGYCSLDADGRVREINARLCEWLGRPRGELLGTAFPGLLAAEHGPAFRQALGRLRAGRAIPELELALRTGPGAPMPVAFAASPVADDDGGTAIARVTLLDVTDRRRAEEQRALVERRYRTIVDTATEGLVLLGTDGVVSFANAQAERMLGLPPGGLAGLEFASFGADGTHERMRARSARRSGGDLGEIREDLELVRADGTTITVQSVFSGFADADGAWSGSLGMLTDVTHLRRVERARREADERARRIVESAQEGIAIVDPGGAVVFANDRLAEMFGLPPEQVVGTDLRERLDGAGRRLVDERLGRRGARDAQPSQFDFRFRRADGSDLWTIVSLAPMYDGDGAWSGSLAMLTDVTERRRAEAERRTADERYRQIVETAREGIGTMDEQGRVTFVNGRAAEMLGLPRHELVGRSILELLVEEDRERLALAVGEARRGREVDEGDLRFVRPDGRTVWVRAAVTAMRDARGRFTGFLGILDDITERKVAQEELQASERRLQAIIDESPALIAVVDLDLRTVVANRALLEFTGIPEDRMLGHPAGHGLPGPVREVVDEMLSRARDGGRLVQEEHTFRVAGRESSWIASAFPLLDDDGAPYALAGLATEVTDLKRAEHEVRALNRELEARVASRTRELELANRDLASFSYTVAHDLRAPLRTIHGFSSLLLEEHAGGLGGDARRYLELVERGATEMGQLIEDLLTFARTGQGDVERRTVETGEVVRDALRDLSGEEPAALEEVGIAPDLPSCYADARLLRIVFQNLLGNALKFTRGVPERRIEVDAEPADGELAFVVRDNGAGFPPDRADRIFGMFQRLHPSEQFEGTGLGLAIVERIVHRHGGRVWAEGAVGEGATIRFTLGSEDAVRRA